jgi:endo-1,4-beta-xylanase
MRNRTVSSRTDVRCLAVASVSGARAWRRWVVRAGLSCLVPLALVLPASAQTIVQNDFEDGTTQGWVSRGGAVLENTVEAAATGSHSLKTTGRTASWNGPSLSMTGMLAKGTLYRFTGFVRLVSGQAADTVKITMQRTASDGTNSFDTIIASATNGVSDGAWVRLSGLYTLNNDVSALLVYVEATGAETQYYLDDFSVVQEPRDDSGIHTNFESGTSEGWGPRGAAVLTPSTADAHGGSYSLLVTNRGATWQGPSIDGAGKMYNGSRYQVVVWVKMAPGEPDTQIRVSIQRSSGGTTNYNTIVPNTVVTASQWVRLKTTFDFVWNYDSLSMYVESNNNPNASFYIDDFDLSFVPPPVIEPDIPSVAQTLADFFPVGAAIYAPDLSGPHADLLTKHFNSVTSENDMKWDATEPTEGSFNFGAADAQVAFAQAHNMHVRGHALVWHNQTPAWVFQDASGVDMSTEPFSEDNKALLLQRMRNHIRALVQHFGGAVSAWDVVNEPFDESQADGFRRTKWFQIVGGPEYIDLAFQYAKEAVDELGLAPGSIKLYLNEYSTTVPAKRAFMAAYLGDALARGIPIDGVGHQMHNNVNWPLNDDPASQDDVVRTIDAFAALGLDNQITEMDVSIYRVNAPGQTIFSDYDDIVAFDQPTLVELGYRYRDYFQIFRRLKDKISNVTLWGLADDHTWRTSGSTVNAPLLFDNRLLAKYAYWGVVDPLQLPGADLAVTIAPDASSVASGHAVAFTITVKNNGHDDADNVTLGGAVPDGTLLQSFTAPADWTCSAPAAGGTGPLLCTIASLASGASAELVLSVAVPCGALDGSVVAASASVGSDTRDPNPAPNNAASVSVAVSNPPPVISGLSADPALLWPPDRRMRRVTLSYDVADNCDATVVPQITITSDQDRPNWWGPHCPDVDWAVLDPP